MSRADHPPFGGAGRGKRMPVSSRTADCRQPVLMGSGVNSDRVSPARRLLPAERSLGRRVRFRLRARDTLFWLLVRRLHVNWRRHLLLPYRLVPYAAMRRSSWLTAGCSPASHGVGSWSRDCWREAGLWRYMGRVNGTPRPSIDLSGSGIWGMCRESSSNTTRRPGRIKGWSSACLGTPIPEGPSGGP
jgi:hypothetical protein